MWAMNQDPMNPLADTMAQSIEHLFLHRQDTLPVRTSRGAFLLAHCCSDEGLNELVRSHVTGCQVATNCYGGGRWFSVTDAFRVGSYLATPESGLCREIIIDFDGESHDKSACMDAALRVVYLMQECGLQPLLELSGSGTGWHIRLLMAEPTAAATLRFLGELVVPDKTIEIFPKAERVPRGEFGSMVWLPYWHGSVGGNGFLCPERFVSYVANPRTVHRHEEDDIVAAIEELSRGVRGKTTPRKWSATAPSPTVPVAGPTATLMSPPLQTILIGWVHTACTNARRGEGRHDLAVRLAARLRDNRIPQAVAVDAMKVFQEAVTGMRDHPFSWSEAESILRYAFRRSPRLYDHCVAAELHRYHLQEKNR
jgi:hypothetical protein